MKRFVGLLAIFVTLAPCGAVALAQQQTKVSKIGWLSARGAANIGQETIVGMLRDLGYVEGKNVAYEYRFADDKLDRLPALAEELVRLKVDVLVTPGTPGALALKKATQTIPIVFTDVTDPIATGLVDSLARPGGNITGVHQRRNAVGRQTAGGAQGNRAETASRCGPVGSAESKLRAGMESDADRSREPWATASFHGGAQRRQI